MQEAGGVSGVGIAAVFVEVRTTVAVEIKGGIGSGIRIEALRDLPFIRHFVAVPIGVWILGVGRAG